MRFCSWALANHSNKKCCVQFHLILLQTHTHRGNEFTSRDSLKETTNTLKRERIVSKHLDPWLCNRPTLINFRPKRGNSWGSVVANMEGSPNKSRIQFPWKHKSRKNTALRTSVIKSILLQLLVQRTEKMHLTSPWSQIMTSTSQGCC